MTSISIQQDIDRSLRLVNPSDLDPDQNCSICHEPLHPAPQIHDTTSIIKPDSPVRLDCGHIFGKICITHWLENHDKCPECRATILTMSLELFQWRETRAEIINALEVDLGDPSSLEAAIARRTIDFIESNSTAQRVPNKSIWWASIYFGHNPLALVDGRGKIWIQERENLVRGGSLSAEECTEMRAAIGVVKTTVDACDDVRDAFGVEQEEYVDMLTI